MLLTGSIGINLFIFIELPFVFRRLTLRFSGRATSNQAFKLTDERHADSGPLHAISYACRRLYRATHNYFALASDTNGRTRLNRLMNPFAI